LLDVIGQCWSFDEFHDEAVRADIVNLTDVRVNERRDSVDLTFEPVAELFRRECDRDLAAHARTAGTINLTHATGTKT
jgi:hypothetical protein